MKKVLSSRDVANIKRMYNIVDPKVQKKIKIASDIRKKQEELKQLDMEISALEAGIKVVTNGVSTQDLIVKKRVPVYLEDGITPMMDKTGQPAKKTVLELTDLLSKGEDGTYILEVEEDAQCPACEENIPESLVTENPIY